MSFIRWCGGKGQSVKYIVPKLIEAIELAEQSSGSKYYI